MTTVRQENDPSVLLHGIQSLDDLYNSISLHMAAYTIFSKPWPSVSLLEHHVLQERKALGYDQNGHYNAEYDQFRYHVERVVDKRIEIGPVIGKDVSEQRQIFDHPTGYVDDNDA